MSMVVRMKCGNGRVGTDDSNVGIGMTVGHQVFGNVGMGVDGNGNENG